MRRPAPALLLGLSPLLLVAAARARGMELALASVTGDQVRTAASVVAALGTLGLIGYVRAYVKRTNEAMRVVNTREMLRAPDVMRDRLDDLLVALESQRVRDVLVRLVCESVRAEFKDELSRLEQMECDVEVVMRATDRRRDPNPHPPEGQAEKRGGPRAERTRSEGGGGSAPRRASGASPQQQGMGEPPTQEGR